MDGVNTSWSRVEGGAAIDAMIDQLLAGYSIAHPEQSVPALVKLYTAVKDIKDNYWKTQKLEEIQHLIEMCSGLFMEATSPGELAVQGDTMRVNISLNNRSGVAVTLKRVSLDVMDSTLNKPLETNRNLNFSKSFYVFTNKPVSQPYWLEHKMSDGSFTVNDQLLIGKPENNAAYEAKFEVTIEGLRLTFTKPVMYKHTDPVKGEQYQPLVVVPPATVTTDPSIVIFRKGQKQKAEIAIDVTANKPFNNYTAKVSKRLTYDNSTQTDTNFTLQPGLQKQYLFNVDNTMLRNKDQDFVQAFVELRNGKEEQPAYLNRSSIRYDHIPHIHYFYQDAIKVLNMDLKTVGKRIGYIEGAGDKVPVALLQMGYEVTVLKEKDITPFNLKQFDAVITGIRAYNVHDYLETKYAMLMDYVKEGGNLIVQYNTSNFISTVSSKIGPYPFAISRNRVTDENAKVDFLLPNHAVLNYPNKITEKDFEGWVQERGIYFADKPDAAYEMPLSMADPNEKAHTGSLIIANYGKGTFVYTGLVFFRELPAGVPGAYRLLANMIALNKKKG